MYEKNLMLGIGVVAALVVVGLFFVNWSDLLGGKKEMQTAMTSTVASSTELDSGGSPSPTPNGEDASGIKPTTTASGLGFQDEIVGTGAEAVRGKTVTVHYIGVFTDGKKFDSSRDRGTPFPFTLGAGEVIKGWDEGVAGMKVGGKRILIVPPELGYGSVANGPIPANSTLMFEVELLGVK